jgi:hypothetical protein
MTETGREAAVNSFKKYCSVCKGKCCRGGELNLFQLERERLALEDTVYKDYCFFCKVNGCELGMDMKPLDCVSYPVYPRVKRLPDGGVEMTGLVVHRSCPFCEEIAGDGPLLRVMKDFWQAELGHIGAEEMGEWFSDDRFWSAENLIKARAS